MCDDLEDLFGDLRTEYEEKYGLEIAGYEDVDDPLEEVVRDIQRKGEYWESLVGAADPEFVNLFADKIALRQQFLQELADEYLKRPNAPKGEEVNDVRENGKAWVKSLELPEGELSDRSREYAELWLEDLPSTYFDILKASSSDYRTPWEIYESMQEREFPPGGDPDIPESSRPALGRNR